jgi:DNA processing protein
LLDKNILGIVGPRKMSSYGQRVVEQMLDYASAYDIVTVSGMAEGVDQLCHSLSISADIPTIAVL